MVLFFTKEVVRIISTNSIQIRKKLNKQKQKKKEIPDRLGYLDSEPNEWGIYHKMPTKSSIAPFFLYGQTSYFFFEKIKIRRIVQCCD
jgi:hypothetical protein